MPPVIAPDDQTEDPALMDEPDPVTPEQPAPEPVSDEPDPAESALLRKFEEDNRRPTAVKDVIDRLEDDREYVHTEANLPDTPGGVATNYILRYQWIHQAQIYAKDPSVAVRPRRKLGILMPAVRQLIEDFGKTVEYLVQHCTNEGKFRSIIDGMIQDVDTVGIMFLKVNWIEDMGKDPTGTFRPNDIQDMQRRLVVMADAMQAGLFGQDDARYKEMTDLAECVRKAMEAEHWRQVAYPTQQPVMDPVTGQPVMTDAGIPAMEDVPYPQGADPRKLRWDGAPTPPQLTDLPRYRGFVFDPYDPEDVTWDNSVRRPELIHRGEHISTRSWMTGEKILADYHISQEDAKDYLPSAITDNRKTRPTENPDSTNRSNEDATERNGTFAVWERQCADGMIYTWVQGGRKFLRQVKKDVVTSSRFNVFALYFNRVSGRVMCVSNVTLGRPIQDEINTVRTHKRQAKRAAYNRYIMNQDLLDPDEQKRLERCPPEGVVFTKRPVADIKAGIFQINGQFNGAVHEVAEEKQELAQSMGVSVVAAGQTEGAEDSATASAIADKFSGQMADKHRAALESFMADIFTYMAEVLVEALPEENAKAIAGPGAVWPMIDRAALWNHLQIEIEAGSTGKPDQEKRRAGLRESIEIGNLMGMGVNPMQPQWNAMNTLRKLADINDWRDDPESLVIAPPPLPIMPGAPGAPVAPSGGGSPTGPAPTDAQPAEPPAGHAAPPPTQPHTLIGHEEMAPV